VITIYLLRIYTSDVVLEARPWPQGALTPNFYGLGLEGPGLGFGLKTCIEIGLEGLRVKVRP